MTESDWLTARDPQAMLAFLREGGWASHRKLRLFACACCRLVWDLLEDPRSQEAVRVAELHANGLATEGEREAVHDQARVLTYAGIAARASASEARFLPWLTVKFASLAAEKAGQEHPGARQCDVIRDLFGTPCVPASPGSTATSLAWAAYDDRLLPSGELDPVRIAVLADALEEAGANARLVDHLRGPGPHWRGCHVLDALLGRS